MSRIIFYFIVFCLVSPNNFAQEKTYIKEEIKTGSMQPQITFGGKIIDARTKEPLGDASIIFPDLKIGTHADNEGKFKFLNVPVGHHLVEVSHIGYTSIIEHIDIDKNTELDFELHPSVLENQGVIVTGVSNATNIRKAPIAVTALRRAEL